MKIYYGIKHFGGISKLLVCALLSFYISVK